MRCRPFRHQVIVTPRDARDAAGNQGHLPDRERAARDAAGQGGARLSDFGFSYVYVIFEDGTDLYWARSRVLEYLSKIQAQLPPGVRTELGPDASGVGWVYQYVLSDRAGRYTLDELRAYQDWTLRYALQSVPGVSEVASLGGYGREYQITVDPNRLAAHAIPILDLVRALGDANDEAGGRLLEWSGVEQMVRVRGYARTLADFEQIVLKVAPGGVPVLLRDVRAGGARPRRGAGWRISTARGTRSAGSWSCATARTPRT